MCKGNEEKDIELENWKRLTSHVKEVGELCYLPSCSLTSEHRKPITGEHGLRIYVDKLWRSELNGMFSLSFSVQYLIVAFLVSFSIWLTWGFLTRFHISAQAERR